MIIEELMHTYNEELWLVGHVKNKLKFFIIILNKILLVCIIYQYIIIYF